MTPRDVDVVVVGSGFSGSILAMILRRLGRSVVLLERGRHPRFAIGESSTPLASLLLEELARTYDLPALFPFTKYGSWKRAHPDVACGLKRGFSFFRHERGRPFVAHPTHDNQLLVAASPNDDIGDVHWYRPDFDHFLVREAVREGAEYRDGAEVDRFEPSADGSVVEGRDERGPFDVRARLVVDATGSRGFLHRTLRLAERALPGMPPTHALYSHFTGVRPFAEVVPAAFGGPAPDGAPAPSPGTRRLPYPPDAAAVHHVLDGGWIWVLRFDNGITSAGLAATDALAAELQLSDGAPAWQRSLARHPSVATQFAGATPAREFTWAPRLSFATSQVAGDGWVMLPSAAGIVDPLLSTGFPLTLLGVSRVADAIARHWHDAPALAGALAAYGRRTQAELDVTARLVGALYRAFDDWPRFTALAHLYFAAASYTESARRLGRPALAGDAFLMSAHPTFGPALERCLTRAATSDDVRDAITPVNVAGLMDDARQNWYPCDAADLLAAAPKLDATKDEVAAMLARCGFTPS
ncbi:MAG: FAD-dependent oxidoreductase [Gemmatimonadota bacterium]|nr:FAD-dependent oxidoreductase [Gemmatimonadota bacterium]